MSRLDEATGPTIRAKVRFRRGRHGRKQVALAVEKEEAELTADPVAEPVPRIARLMALAIVMDEMVRSGQVKSYAELARIVGVSRARVSQVVGLLNLTPDTQKQLLEPPATSPPSYRTTVRAAARSKQRALLRGIRQRCP